MTAAIQVWNGTVAGRLFEARDLMLNTGREPRYCLGPSAPPRLRLRSAASSDSPAKGQSGLVCRRRGPDMPVGAFGESAAPSRSTNGQPAGDFPVAASGRSRRLSRYSKDQPIGRYRIREGRTPM